MSRRSSFQEDRLLIFALGVKGSFNTWPDRTTRFEPYYFAQSDRLDSWSLETTFQQPAHAVPQPGEDAGLSPDIGRKRPHAGSEFRLGRAFPFRQSKKGIAHVGETPHQASLGQRPRLAFFQVSVPAGNRKRPGRPVTAVIPLKRGTRFGHGRAYQRFSDSMFVRKYTPSGRRSRDQAYSAVNDGSTVQRARGLESKPVYSNESTLT